MKRFSRVALCMLVATLGFCPGAARANIELDKVVMTFPLDGRPVDNVTVRNRSDAPVKITVKAIEAQAADAVPPQEIAAKDIIVAPKAFELGAGEARAVRIVLRAHPDDREGVFRIRFTPSEPSVIKDVAVTGGKSVHVGITVTMGMLVMVAPRNPRPDLAFTRRGDVIHFTNAGNVTAQLQREEYCSDDKKTCAPLEGYRLYPGMTWDMTAPKALSHRAFTQTVLMNGNYSTLSYPEH